MGKKKLPPKPQEKAFSNNAFATLLGNPHIVSEEKSGESLEQEPARAPTESFSWNAKVVLRKENKGRRNEHTAPGDH